MFQVSERGSIGSARGARRQDDGDRETEKERLHFRRSTKYTHREYRTNYTSIRGITLRNSIMQRISFPAYASCSAEPTCIQNKNN